MGHVEHLQGWRAPWNEADFISALTGGGDSRLRVDPASGTNKYFVPPIPRDEGVCFSTCTASPISQAGYRQAMRCYVDLATARSHEDAAARRASWRAKVTGQLTGALQFDGLADILLLPSGPDGLLLCSILLSLEAGRRSMTAILPAAAETGSGVPRAAVRQAFDGLLSGGPLVGVVEVPLRELDGSVRSEDAVNEEFALAARTGTGRPVVFVTYGSKTGLVAPLAVPPGVEVVVDACQLRLSPAVIRECLRKGWPVVVTGSKSMGGPPFSGAVLLPRGRFSGFREKALAEWSCIVAASGAQRALAGPLLRWVAATEHLNQLQPEDRFATTPADRMNAGRLALARVPGVAMIEGPSRPMIEAPGHCPEIISFSVADPRNPATLLTAGQLRGVHLALAGRGVLLGQPVDVGPFGVLRLAFGMRDRRSDQLAAGLEIAVGVLSDILARPNTWNAAESALPVPADRTVELVHA